MRTVELIGFDAGGEEVGRNDAWHSAVGYLSTWGLGAYPHVRIVFDLHHYELLASYWAEAPESVPGTRPGYVIGAIWNVHTQRFSFHS